MKRLAPGANGEPTVSSMSNPYDHLPETAFWRPAVALRHFSEIGPLWSPKFDIRPEHRVVTFGSCFAQHIGRSLQRRGFSWLCTEPPPPDLPDADARRFGYGIFSCRTGNIYTTSLLLQWARWALLDQPAPPEVWAGNGRYFDPFRPAVEPGGFATADELLASREVTIKAFSEAIRSADVLVFTLGLTECWFNTRHGHEYPMCPGTAAGSFDGESHGFSNLDVLEVTGGLHDAIDIIHAANNNLRIIMTVSPVPLTATNSGHHVLVATTETKSILRAAVGQLARHRPYVDYFPGYEMISSPVMQGMFFQPNRRQVSPMGVDFVMDHFISCLRQKFGVPSIAGATLAPRAEKTPDDVACEEELLAAFGDRH